MKCMTESGIKFNTDWIKGEPLNISCLKEINSWRDKLYKFGFIGVNDDKIGYGNLSIRFGQNNFIITGASTGRFKKLTARHYTLVTGYDLQTNRVKIVGPIEASSETLTHAAIYSCDEHINAVIHIHHSGLWKKLLDTAPRAEDAAYGTTDMAYEIIRLFKRSILPERKLLVMAGHQDGILSFGASMDEAGERIVSEFRTFNQEII
jgi:L-ribulose-5-phosphate 4-epimerase